MLLLDLQLSPQHNMVHDVFCSQAWCQRQSYEFYLHSDNKIASESHMVKSSVTRCTTVVQRFSRSRVSGSDAVLLYLRLCVRCAGKLQITGKVAFPGHVSYTHGTCSLSPASSPICVHA